MGPDVSQHSPLWTKRSCYVSESAWLATRVSCCVRHQSGYVSSRPSSVGSTGETERGTCLCYAGWKNKGIATISVFRTKYECRFVTDL